MITRLPTRGTVLLTVAFVIASLLLTLHVWRSVGGALPLQPKRYEVVALFDNASQLTPNADVRISGVNVGHVASVVPRGLRSEARLALEARFAPLPNDVRAVLRQKTLLGETFVELSPGSRDAPKLREGAQIAPEQIADTQPLDRVLGMLDRPTRDRLRELLSDGGALLEGRGLDLNASLGNLALGTRQLQATVEILDRQRGDVGSLVRDAGAVLRTVGDEEEAVGELIRSGRSVLSATAARERELTQVVRQAPGLLRELRRTADAAERTATLAAPVLDDFRPVAPLVAPTLRATRDTSPQLASLLEDLDDLLPTARRALRAAGAILTAASGMMDAIEPVASEITPVIGYMATYRRELIATMANVSASTMAKGPTTRGDQRAYLRTLIPIGPESMVGWEERLGSNRHAAYREPGGLAALAEGLTSAGCTHASESSDAPPCRVQPGWSFGGGPARYFQRIEPATAGDAAAVVRAIVALVS